MLLNLPIEADFVTSCAIEALPPPWNAFTPIKFKVNALLATLLLPNHIKTFILYA